MYSEFIIDINKSHQYGEVGDRDYEVSQLQGRNDPRTIQSER